MLMPGQSLLLVGVGRMGSAFLQGWINAGMPARCLTVLDPSPSLEVRSYMKKQRINAIESSDQAVAVDVVVLAIKPQMMDEVLPNLKHCIAANTVVISIAAGIPMARFEEAFGEDTAVVRTMPNTPAVVNRAITVAIRNDKVSHAHKSVVHALLATVGDVVWITDEGMMHAVTGVSGSGPAYVFYLAECLAKAGEAQGLPEEFAKSLAYTTVCGAAELMYKTKQQPAKLRQDVTSPNGTTAAALDVLMREDALEKIMIETVEAATMRSEELSGEKN